LCTFKFEATKLLFAGSGGVVQFIAALKRTAKTHAPLMVIYPETALERKGFAKAL
jgi:hypothetical protein